MLLSAPVFSSPSLETGENFRTLPYNFCAAKPIFTIAFRNSIHGTSPGVLFWPGWKNNVLKTRTRWCGILTLRCASSRGVTSVFSGWASGCVDGCGFPLVLTFPFFAFVLTFSFSPLWPRSYICGSWIFWDRALFLFCNGSMYADVLWICPLFLGGWSPKHESIFFLANLFQLMSNMLQKWSIFFSARIICSVFFFRTFLIYWVIELSITWHW